MTTKNRAGSRTKTNLYKRRKRRSKNGTADASVVRKACDLCEAIIKVPVREELQEKGTEIAGTINTETERKRDRESN